MQKNVDDILKFGKGIDDAGAQNIGSMFNKRFGDARITSEAMEGIQRNIDDFALDASTATEEQLFRGITGASTYKGNMLTQAFNTDGATGLGGLLMGAGVGALGAAAVGGDAREGAVFGGIAGLGAAATGRAIMKNVGSIEENFMNTLLKNKTISKGGELIPETLEDVAKRSEVDVADLTPKHLQDAGYGSMTSKQLLGKQDDAIPDVNALIQQGHGNIQIANHIDPNLKFAGHQRTPVTKTPAMQALNTRAERIEAISNPNFLTPQDIKKAGFGAQYKKDVLMGTKDLNVAQATRISGFVGSALTGMAFSAKRRDHRRGFNSKRGNRV